MDRSVSHDQSPQPAEIAEQLFFIVGCPRSGTSLLQSMLTCHPETVLPNETGFYTLIRPRHLRRLGELATRETFEQGCEAALSFWRIEALELEADEVRNLCAQSDPSWESVFLAILTAFARKHGAHRVGEKSPGHVYHLPLLAKRFPQAKFIHVIRDPRAVVLSLLKVKFGSRFIAPLCRRWAAAIRMHREFADQLGPDRYRDIRYEDLVQNPEQVLRDLCSFLNLEFSDSMLEHHKRGIRGFADRQSRHMANTLKPVFASSIDKWSEELSARQVALIEYVLHDEMEAMKYTPIGKTTALPALQCAIGNAGFLAESLSRRLNPKSPRYS